MLYLILGQLFFQSSVYGKKKYIIIVYGSISIVFTYFVAAWQSVHTVLDGTYNITKKYFF